MRGYAPHPDGGAASGASGEDFAGLVQTVDEAVDLVLERVEVEAGSVRRRHSELLHQRLAAVVPGADGDALHVENLRHLVGMDVAEIEGDDARAPLSGRPVELP